MLLRSIPANRIKASVSSLKVVVRICARWKGLRVFFASQKKLIKTSWSHQASKWFAVCCLSWTLKLKPTLETFLLLSLGSLVAKLSLFKLLLFFREGWPERFFDHHGNLLLSQLSQRLAPISHSAISRSWMKFPEELWSVSYSEGRHMPAAMTHLQNSCLNNWSKATAWKVSLEICSWNGCPRWHKTWNFPFTTPSPIKSQILTLNSCPCLPALR